MKKSRRRRSDHLDIVYQDREMIVINKEGGVLSVPIEGSSARNIYGMLLPFLGRNKQRPFIVHRLDRYTSGLLVFAKDPVSRHNLIQQFLAHTPVRKYLALVEGSLPDDKGEMEDYLRLTKNGFRQEVSGTKKNGAERALLKYEVLERYSDIMLVEISLITGLKNQIRVQFSSRGFPIVGERQYVPEGGMQTHFPGLDRQALHASELVLAHPRSKKEMLFSVPLPPDMERILKMVSGKR